MRNLEKWDFLDPNSEFSYSLNLSANLGEYTDYTFKYII